MAETTSTSLTLLTPVTRSSHELIDACKEEETNASVARMQSDYDDDLI